MCGGVYHRLIMLGTSLETLGGIAAVVKVYRANGLFERWPLDYVATHCDGGGARKLLRAAGALFEFVLLLLAHHGRALVHVHGASRASFWRKSVFMALAHLAGCPVIFHLHGGGFARFYEVECGRLKRRLIRFFLDRAACVIVLSERWRAWMQGVTRNSHVVCIPNPAPPPSDQVAWSGNHVVLFLGRIERAKGVFDLLDTVCALRAAIPDIRLVCAGDGELEQVARHVEQLGIKDLVTFPGWVGSAEKQSLMGHAAVFVLPSYAEGLPMSLLEAMAAGMPVVATAVGGIPDVVTDGLDGFLFAPGDTAKLRHVLQRLMRDPELCLQVARAARDTIRLRFAPDRVLGQLEEVYRGLGLESAAAESAVARAQ